jgi:hypothetical protein
METGLCQRDNQQVVSIPSGLKSRKVRKHHWHEPPQPYPPLSFNTAKIQPDVPYTIKQQEDLLEQGHGVE